MFEFACGFFREFDWTELDWAELDWDLAAAGLAAFDCAPVPLATKNKDAVSAVTIRAVDRPVRNLLPILATVHCTNIKLQFSFSIVLRPDILKKVFRILDLLAAKSNGKHRIQQANRDESWLSLDKQFATSELMWRNLIGDKRGKDAVELPHPCNPQLN